MKFRDFYRSILLLTMLLGIAACATTPIPPAQYLAQQDSYHEEINVNRQGLKLFSRFWHPIDLSQDVANPTQPKGIVMIIHGTSLHSGLYGKLGKTLADEGFLVQGIDLQGWGQSQSKGAKGFVTSFDDYVLDVSTYINRFKLDYPAAPIYLVGESLGGTVAVYGSLKHQLAINGIITSGVGYKPNPALLGIRAPGFINNMNQTMGEMWGGVFPNWPAVPSDIGIRTVIEDDTLQDKLLNDPHVTHGWLPAAYITALISASDYISENLEALDTPILLLHGEHDSLIPLESSKEIYQHASSSDKTLKVYNSEHAVLLEPEHVQAVKDIKHWLNERVTDNRFVATH